MSTHFEVIGPTAPSDEFPMGQMGVADVCVLTKNPDGVPLGIAVFRAVNEWCFPGRDTWTGNHKGYFVRRLRPNEQIVIKGK